MKNISEEFYKNDIKGKVTDDEEQQIDSSIDYYKVVENELFEDIEKRKIEIIMDILFRAGITLEHLEECGCELPDGYHFVDENGNVIDTTKIRLVKNTPYYPKSYDECCQYLGCDDKIKMKLIGQFTRLINARNAYWKIAGEQLGLGKPWEPDWNDNNQPKFGIHNVQNDIRTINLRVLKNLILVFPTEEMRDTFYNNFKDLIEECKEML